MLKENELRNSILELLSPQELLNSQATMARKKIETWCTVSVSERLEDIVDHRKYVTPPDLDEAFIED